MRLLYYYIIRSNALTNFETSVKCDVQKEIIKIDSFFLRRLSNGSVFRSTIRVVPKSLIWEFDTSLGETEREREMFNNSSLLLLSSSSSSLFYYANLYIRFSSNRRSPWIIIFLHILLLRVRCCRLCEYGALESYALWFVRWRSVIQVQLVTSIFNMHHLVIIVVLFGVY